MVCASPIFLILLMTAKGPQYVEVEKKYLKPDIQSLDSEANHAECRRRKLGDCLSQIRLNPMTGHISFLCKRLDNI